MSDSSLRNPLNTLISPFSAEIKHKIPQIRQNNYQLAIYALALAARTKLPVELITDYLSSYNFCHIGKVK